MTTNTEAGPVAWLCQFAQEDGSTTTQIVQQDPAGLRWNDAGEPSPYATTPLYAHRPAAEQVATAYEACASICERISEEYQRTESRKYPELKSDAETGAAKCVAAIRAALAAHPPAPEQPAPSLADMEALRQQKDGAYLERNKCVALIARMAAAMGLPVAITKTAIEGWSEDWHGCIYIGLPTGQVSWHFHDSQAYLFDGLPRRAETWDGHDTPEKYRRVEAAFTHPTPADPGEPAAEHELRHLLAFQVAGATLYTDDGELQDNSELPAIDFKRDAPGEIARKLTDRGLTRLTKPARVHALVNDGPCPGMSEAFDAHMGAACWTDPAYRSDAAMWAAAWKASARTQPALRDAAQQGLTEERTVFEAWASSQGFNTERDDTPKYREYHIATTRWVWLAWQARATLKGQPAEQQGLTELPDEGELEAWRFTADQLLGCSSDNPGLTRRAALLLQNAYLFAATLKGQP